MFSQIFWWFKFRKDSQNSRAKETASAEESRMRAERVRALTVSPDGASTIKSPEDLVRYFRNVPEKMRREVLLCAKEKRRE